MCAPGRAAASAAHACTSKLLAVDTRDLLSLEDRRVNGHMLALLKTRAIHNITLISATLCCSVLTWAAVGSDARSKWNFLV